MESKNNFKKLLCYNIVNNCKCVYKNKCMFAHTLEEQKKEPIRQYIHNMLYEWEDLSNININKDKLLMDELLILTKECKNCINKRCPGGYNCRFGTCLKENKICYNDLMYGKCYNILIETEHNGIILNSCIHGIHLTEKKIIPYNQRILSEITNSETNFLMKPNINFNSKNNIISIGLNDSTIKLVKEIITNKMSKKEIIYNLKKNNKLLNNIFDNSNNNDSNDDDSIIDLLNEENKDKYEYNKVYKELYYQNENIIGNIIILENEEKEDNNYNDYKTNIKMFNDYIDNMV